MRNDCAGCSGLRDGMAPSPPLVVAAVAAWLALMVVVVLTEGPARDVLTQSVVHVARRLRHWKPVPGHKTKTNKPCKCATPCEYELSMRYPSQGEHSPKGHMCSVVGESLSLIHI